MRDEVEVPGSVAKVTEEKKWNRKTKKINERYRLLPKLRSPPALPSHVTWVTLCLGLASKHPRCRAPGRLTGGSGGLGGWEGVGLDVQFDHRLISGLDFSNDRPHRGWHRAGGLYFYSNLSQTQSLCTAGIFVKRNAVKGRLYFPIVATSWLMNHCLLFPQIFFFLLLCAWFIDCKENTFCSLRTNKSLLKESTFTFFPCVCVFFFHSAGLVLGQPANHRYQTWKKLNWWLQDIFNKKKIQELALSFNIVFLRKKTDALGVKTKWNDEVLQEEKDNLVPCNMGTQLTPTIFTETILCFFISPLWQKN